MSKPDRMTRIQVHAHTLVELIEQEFGVSHVLTTELKDVRRRIDAAKHSRDEAAEQARKGVRVRTGHHGAPLHCTDSDGNPFVQVSFAPAKQWRSRKYWAKRMRDANGEFVYYRVDKYGADRDVPEPDLIDLEGARNIEIRPAAFDCHYGEMLVDVRIAI